MSLSEHIERGNVIYDHQVTTSQEVSKVVLSEDWKIQGINDVSTTSTSGEINTGRLAFILIGNEISVIIRQILSIYKTTQPDDIFRICVLGLLSAEQKDTEEYHDITRTIDEQFRLLKDECESFDASKVIRIESTIDVNRTAENRLIGAQYIWDLYKHNSVENSIVKNKNTPEMRDVASDIEIMDRDVQNDLILIFMKSDVIFLHEGWSEIVEKSFHHEPTNISDSNEDNGQVHEPISSIYSRGNNHIVSFPTTSMKATVDYKLSPNYESVIHEYLKKDDDGEYEYFISPIVDGSVTAMRLTAFLNFPVNDPFLEFEYFADLQLSWNSWLCGGGIHMIPSLQHFIAAPTKHDPLYAHKSLMRLAHVWMSDFSKKHLVFAHVDQKLKFFPGQFFESINQFQWERNTTTWYEPNLNECQSFDWYVENINDAMDEKVISNILLKQTNHHHANETTETIMPSSEVRYMNQFVISKTQLINVSYVSSVDHDIRFNPTPIALDENGNEDHEIFNETSVRMISPAFEFDATVEENFCSNVTIELKKVLTEKVSIDFETHNRKEMLAKHSNEFIRPKLFCMVYTHDKDHDRIPVIHQTWGGKCDAFMASSNQTDKTLGTVNIPHEGNEEYLNMWQKVRSMWSYTYENYYDKYDWFYIGTKHVMKCRIFE